MSKRVSVGEWESVHEWYRPKKLRPFVLQDELEWDGFVTLVGAISGKEERVSVCQWMGENLSMGDARPIQSVSLSLKSVYKMVWLLWLAQYQEWMNEWVWVSGWVGICPWVIHVKESPPVWARVRRLGYSGGLWVCSWVLPSLNTHTERIRVMILHLLVLLSSQQFFFRTACLVGGLLFLATLTHTRREWVKLSFLPHFHRFLLFFLSVSIFLSLSHRLSFSFSSVSIALSLTASRFVGFTDCLLW